MGGTGKGTKISQPAKISQVAKFRTAIVFSLTMRYFVLLLYIIIIIIIIYIYIYYKNYKKFFISHLRTPF